MCNHDALFANIEIVTYNKTIPVKIEQALFPLQTQTSTEMPEAEIVAPVPSTASKILYVRIGEKGELRDVELKSDTFAGLQHAIEERFADELKHKKYKVAKVDKSSGQVFPVSIDAAVAKLVEESILQVTIS
jgi:hypothetical protein